MKYLVPLLLLVGVPLTAGEPTLIYMVRHAEKEPCPGDPPLSPEGLARVERLRQFLGKVEFDAVFATHLQRTQETAGPLALERGLPLTITDAQDLAGLAKEVQKLQGQTILIAGHSNTIPDLIFALSGNVLAIADEDYNNLFLLVLEDRGSRLHHFRFADDDIVP